MKKKYQLIVHFNEYTGNFHREFNAHVFAYDSQTHDWITTLCDKAIEELGGEDAVEELHQKYLEFINDEYGSNISAITHYKRGQGTLAITVYFTEFPEPILPTIYERIKSFPATLADTCKFGSKSVKVEKIELMEQTIEETILSTITF
jgi:hypothetical protein